MRDETADARAVRLARAKAFLEAGKTEIDTRPQDGSSAGKPPTEKPSSETGKPEEDKPPRPDPTRYGDWEKNGRCIDF